MDKQVHTPHALGTSSYPYDLTWRRREKNSTLKFAETPSYNTCQRSIFTLVYLYVHFQTHRNHGKKSTYSFSHSGDDGPVHPVSTEQAQEQGLSQPRWVKHTGKRTADIHAFQRENCHVPLEIQEKLEVKSKDSPDQLARSKLVPQPEGLTSRDLSGKKAPRDSLTTASPQKDF